MRQSQLFTKTRKEAPSDEVSKNAQLLIRAGFISKEMAGVYNYLSLGLRVFKKIENIIRDEMNELGGQEVVMSSLQRKELWEKTNRWSDKEVDAWFKTVLKNGSELGLGFTHEEPITNMMEQFVPSYQNLPVYVYQFQNKFRNEERSKSGILRTREFVMKDLYSFSADENSHNEFYREMTQAYERIFQKVGIGEFTYMTFASGGSFSKYSHEFQTITDSGEDTIYALNDQTKINFAINKEVYTDETLRDLGYTKEQFTEKRAVEVGNTFTLGTRFSEALLCKFKDKDGKEINPFMGSYGIGVGRLMGTIVEVLADDKGLVWPIAIAPFKVHLVELSQGNAEIKKTADDLYADLTTAGVEVLYDDRDARAGEKFADSDLIGIPYRVVIGKSTTTDSIEVVRRTDGNVTQYSRSAILSGTYAS